MMKVKQKKKIKSPEGALTTSPALSMEEKVITKEKLNYPPKQTSNIMQKNPGEKVNSGKKPYN